ncbi:hypothetical protein GAYE_SCF06G2776 [Galdieria yellowstonensis]|uniref:GINS subunit domain-containing protein n=1 Tax=Galdieria yellowstonensis TaxID=3028027 RepID=A0AAV9IBT6_9RHOD|nr:hypothetical protein GAYE_SCF06G2776 [Galdieria yellowstonensis]
MIYKRPCYWDLKDIISTSEKVRSVLQTDLENLEHLSELTKIEYPEDIQWERFRKLASLEGKKLKNECDEEPSVSECTSKTLSEVDNDSEEVISERTSSVKDEEKSSQKLPAGTRVELPFWLAETLAVRNFVNLQMPHSYGSRTRKDIIADATFVSLKSKASFYYRYGNQLAQCLGDHDLRERLLYAFANRYRKILQVSHSIMTIQSQQRSKSESQQVGLTSIPNSLSEFIKKLDDSERELLAVAIDSSSRLQEWRTRSLGNREKDSYHSGKRVREFESADWKPMEKLSRTREKGSVLTELSLNEQNRRASHVFG